MNERRVEITTENFEPVIKHLSNAIKWLDSDQPENAVMFHLGMHLNALEASSIQISIGIIPIGGGARPTFVLDKPYIADETSHTGSSQDRFTEGEIEVIRQGITAAGGEIFDSWNGVGLPTVSFSLTKFAGEKVRKLVDNYSQHMTQYGFSWPPEITALYGLTVKPEHWV